MDAQQLRTLLAVVDEGTFDSAAAVLQVTASAVSQRVKALEQTVGRLLLLRTKPVRLTESGKVVARLARQLARLERDVRAELGLVDDDEPNRLPIAINADSLATWFLPALTRIPEDLRISFELHREDAERAASLLREGAVMAAVTSSSTPSSGCVVRRLGCLRYVPVASPEFVSRWLDGPLRERLPTAPVLVIDRGDDLQDRFVDRLAPGHTASGHRHHMATSESVVTAAAAGLGWGMVPAMQATRWLAAGTLIDLTPGAPMDVPLFWHQWKVDSPVLSAAADAVTAAAAALAHEAGRAAG
ncbi:LysR family transcriptional regulator ArgP [Actinophytocola sp. KF-1]